VYTSSAIPGWKNSVLLTCLKGKKLVRLQLNAAGNKIISDTINYFKGDVRYRDIALSPDGNKIYMAVDSTSVTSGPSAQNPDQTSYRGCILEFTYQGQDASNHQPAQSSVLPGQPAHRRKSLKSQ
jgi:glucose/arabinose dehydrogenase